MLCIHWVHGQHQGTALEGTWRALLTQVRLQANQSRYQPEIITDTLQRIDKELLAQQLKESTKSEAKRQHGQGNQFPRQNRQNKDGKGLPPQSRQGPKP